MKLSYQVDRFREATRYAGAKTIGQRIDYALFACLIVLSGGVDVPMRSSLIFDRSKLVWSPWLYRLGLLTPADLIASVILLRIVVLYLRGRRGFAAPYVLLALYLALGTVNGLIFGLEVKPLLYCFKVVIFASAPFLLKSRIEKVALCWILNAATLIGNSLDYLGALHFGGAEYPSASGLGPFPFFFSIPVLFFGLTLASKKLRIFSGLGIFLTGLTAVDRHSLGNLFIVLLGLIATRAKRKTFAPYAIMGLLLVTFSLDYLVVTGSFSFLTATKKAGVETRQRQLSSVVRGDGPVWLLTGHGLGTTWRVWDRPDETDIYSVGTSFGDANDAIINRPRLFVLNSFAAPVLQYWGIGGFLAICTIFFRKVKYTSKELVQQKVVTMYFFGFTILAFGQARLTLQTAILLAATVNARPSSKTASYLRQARSLSEHPLIANRRLQTKDGSS
jgi:hypothetical protein